MTTSRPADGIEAAAGGVSTGSDPLPGPLHRIDAFQQRHRVVGVPFAVYKKFSDDDAGRLASLVSYYAFLSVFPLLIVLATVVSRLLVGHPDLADDIVQTAAGSFLSVGSAGATFTPLDVSGPALALALVVGLWSGLAVANGMQDAMDTVYEVPRTSRASFAGRISRSLSLLVLVGIGLPLATVLQGLAVRAVGGPFASVVALVAVIVLNTGIIATAFRRATVAPIGWREVLPGAALAAVAWSVLQAVATGLLTSRIAGAQTQYGTFAVVVGLLFWFFLLAQITLYCAELNAVLAFRLWPRGLATVVRGQADTEADIRAYRHYAAREQQAANMSVEVHVVTAPSTQAEGEPASSVASDEPHGPTDGEGAS